MKMQTVKECKMHTMGRCNKCGKTFLVEDLKLLPEAEAYQRDLAKAICSGNPPPAELDEEVLRERYGYDSTDLFCYECMGHLLLGKR